MTLDGTVMKYKDYYKDLGVSSSATPEEIKKAYRTLAKRYHPDKARGDKAAEDRFKEINEAHDVLSDPAKRTKYDQFGADWKHYEEAGAQPGGFDWSKYTSGQGEQHRGSGFDDLFEMLFGNPRNQERTQRSAVRAGEDIEAETALTLEEAYRGTIRLIQVHGETIKVTIKAGVEDQQVLRIAGKGSRGRSGGPNGNLYLTVKINPHPVYRRTGNNLHRVLPVDLYTAVLGGKTSIETLKGKVKVNIPKGTPNGKELRLRGLGMPDHARKNVFGDLMVTVDVVLPAQLSNRETELFKELQAIRT
jgi:curved DNA-binding protein